VLSAGGKDLPITWNDFVISLHNVSSAGEALQYFSKDNYYTDREGLEESEWFGKGAVALGFEGKIDKRQFFDALHGKLDGQELGKWIRNETTGEKEREHRPGIDITFSAPKSVSLMAEVHGSRQVREAHEAAVKAALGYIEREFSYTRRMEDGELESVKTGNLVVGMFRHNTSRELDPQTHTHAIVMNATKREDGQWRSLTNDEIYRAQRVVGAIYTAELADRLQRLGYELRRTDDRGNFEIMGITREQVEHFSQRRTGMEAHMKKRGVDIHEATAQEKESAALATRARKTDVDRQELFADWKKRAKEVGIDFEAIQQQADVNRACGGVMRADRLSGRKAMEFAAAHLIEREAVVSKNELLQVAVEHSAGRVSPHQVEKAFEKLQGEGHLIELPDGKYTTKKMLGSESWTLDQVRDTKGQEEQIMAAAAVQEKLAGIEKRQGFAYSEGQKEAITTVLASRDRFVAVQGLAGTGKTTMLKGLRELAQERGYAVRGMAPTGAASKVLIRETGIVSETVSMFQIKERQLQRDIEFAQQYSPEFRRQRELWIVDESSFLSQRQKAQLDYMANKAGAKVVYLGDALQFQAVEAGKPFEMAQRNGIQTAYMTEISRQKTPDLKEAVDIITGRHNVGADDRLTRVQLTHNARAFSYMDKAGMVSEVKGGNAIDELVKDFTTMSKAERERAIIITAYNKDRRDINQGVRETLKQRGELADNERQFEVYAQKGWTRAMTKEAQYYKKGDVVRFGRSYRAIDAQKGEYMRVASADAPRGIVVLEKAGGTQISWEPKKHNNVEVYEVEQRALAQGDLIRVTRSGSDLKNGETGRVVLLSGDNATIELSHGKHVVQHEVNLRADKHWDHAYASTVHAAQGATQHRVLFHIRAPESENERKQERAVQSMAKIFGDRSFYVGTTRASHELRIYTNDKSVAAMAVTGKQDKTSAFESLQQYNRDATADEKRPDITR
jgi:conjugative relaxase-like TrwC/TraI family protein